jgi:hypothetical protein
MKAKSSHLTEFSPETIKALGAYVYALVDPHKDANDPKRHFYVGKGIRNRCFDHAAAEARWKRKDGPDLKLQRIRTIRRATGAPPPIQIIAHKLDQESQGQCKESFRLEAALISVLQTDKDYCGRIAGIGGADCSLTVDEIEGLYSNPLEESAIGYRVLLVSLNGSKDNKRFPPFPGIAKSDIAERVLGYWPVADERADQVEYIIGCYQLLTRIVFRVKQKKDGCAKHKYGKYGTKSNGYPIWKQVFRGKPCLEKEQLDWCNRRIINSSGQVLTKFRRQEAPKLIGNHS